MDIQAEASTRKLVDSPKRGGRSTSRKCICLTVTAVVLGLGLLFLILGLTVFKAKHPKIAVNSVSLDDINFAFDMTRVRVLLNVSLDINVSVKNPNRVGFKYHDSTAILRHRGNDIGEAPIPAGRIGADKSTSLNFTLSVMADRLLSDSSLYSDVLSGTLPFQTYIRMSGKVRLIFNIHVVAYSTCDVDVDIGNRRLSNLVCKYKTKL